MTLSQGCSLVALYLALHVSAGCASIVKGKTQNVSIESNVRGATIIVDGQTVGKTPFSGPIPRGSDTTILVKKDGYEPRRMTLSTEIEPIFWGNIIFGGFFGSTTDMGTQAMYKYAPATIMVDLEVAAAEAKPAPEAPPTPPPASAPSPAPAPGN